MDRAILEDLAERVERTPEQVQAEIEALQRTGNYSENGALVVWKSNNKFALSSGKPQELKIRVLGRRNPRIATLSSGESKVADIDVVYVDADNTPDFGKATLWGDRADIATQVVVGGTYKVMARVQTGGEKTKLTALDLIDTVDDADVPSLDDMEKTGWEFGNLATIEQEAGREEIFKGMVGRLIQAIDGGSQIIGFEMSNPTDSSIPITVWGGRGRDDPAPSEVQDVLQSLAMGDEAYAWGYVNAKTDGTIALNASGIFKV